MSGQFTESYRTLEGANRNQCRDSLQSLVGPIKELTGINVGTVYRVLSDPLKSRTLKRCAQFFKKGVPSKGVPNLSKGVPSKKACPLCQKMCHEKACQFVGRQEARDTRGCLGYLTKTKAEAEAYHSETSETNPSLKKLCLCGERNCGTLCCHSVTNPSEHYQSEIAISLKHLATQKTLSNPKTWPLLPVQLPRTCSRSFQN
ncbi:unnamed protein product [Camellia sinensis]